MNELPHHPVTPSPRHPVIRTGAHIFLWINVWSDAELPLMDHVRELGLDFLEIAWGDDVRLTPRLARERAASLGLELVFSPGGDWPMACDIAREDPADQRRGLEWHRHAIDVAAEAGAVAYTGAIYGHPGYVQRRRPTGEEYRRIADHLHALAEHAARQGMILALEPMSHFRTHLVNRPEQVMCLIEMAGHPNLRVLLDTYHLVTEIRNYAEAVRTTAPKLWGLHACENDRGAPGGGLVPWPAIGEALSDAGFAGYVGLESYLSAPGGLAEVRGLFNDPCPNGDAFVRQGLAFLREAGVVGS